MSDDLLTIETWLQRGIESEFAFLEGKPLIFLPIEQLGLWPSLRVFPNCAACWSCGRETPAVAVRVPAGLSAEEARQYIDRTLWVPIFFCASHAEVLGTKSVDLDKERF